MDTYEETLIISHSSALELLRQPGMELTAAQKRCGVPDFDRIVATPGLVDRTSHKLVSVGSLQRPIHALVGCESARSVGPKLVTHKPRCTPPKNSLVQLASHAYACGPELCLVQLAPRLSLPALIALVMECIGTYAVTGSTDEAHSRTRPLTTLTSIGLIVRQISGESGSRAVLQALRYARPGSASPYETRLVELACLPSRWGGYGLPAPVMNHEIAVPDEVRKIARRSNIRFDLYWPEQRVALEYDGRKHHSNETDVTGDTGRRDAAVAMGIMYFSVRYGQIADVNAMDDVFRSVAKALGYRLRIRTDNFAEKRGELRRILLPGSAN